MVFEKIVIYTSKIRPLSKEQCTYLRNSRTLVMVILVKCYVNSCWMLLGICIWMFSVVLTAKTDCKLILYSLSCSSIMLK